MGVDEISDKSCSTRNVATSLVHQKVKIIRGFTACFLTPLTGGHELLKQVQKAFREPNLWVSAQNLPDIKFLDDLGTFRPLTLLRPLKVSFFQVILFVVCFTIIDRGFEPEFLL